jgi:hypothetical protein
MVMLDEDFDATAHESSNDYAPLPAGEYKLCAVASEMKTTKKGDGKYISFEFQVLSSLGEGRKIFANYNWVNPNEKAVSIGKEQFAALCKAVGILKPESTEQLHNIPFSAVVGIQKGTGEYGDSNVIKKYQESASIAATTPKAKAPKKSETSDAEPWDVE